MAETSFPGADWATGPLASDVDGDAVDAAISVLAEHLPEIGTTESLVLVHNGQLVREMYGPETNSESTLISWSMAKTITQALIGIAVGDGLLSVNDSDLLPQWHHDSRSQITLGNLLNMASGLAWREDYVDDQASDVIEMLFGNGDLVGDHASFTAAKNLEVDPGTKYLYSSGTTNIICRVLANALGEQQGSSDAMKTFMQSRLFDPLGMTSAIPRFDAVGTFVGSSYVYATAKDFARFGYLYLQDGMWGDTRILPPGWVKYSRTPFARDEDNGFDYGAHLWMTPLDPGAMLALGYDGQFTWVSPKRNLVLVRTGKKNSERLPRLVEELLKIITAFPATHADIGNDGVRV
ncbi:unannotated protein [freshwater metagenome]|uniref:Unannotated protein n=1 Tax=freshwater metagenome TaxID=449393 RepID=A0A6J6HSQ6_9ZZZZ|nr:serine hydrolase [Actinomycetota bacterium]MSZ96480.1 serine hydrolase [Actinomycetota bacterium]